MPKQNTLQGSLRVSRDGSAWFIPDAKEAEDLYIDAKNTHTALHLDEVLVERLVERPARPQRRFQSSKIRRPRARVLAVRKRSHLKLCGWLKRGYEGWELVAESPHIPHSFALTNTPAFKNHLKDGHKAFVELLEWSDPQAKAKAKLIEILGAPESSSTQLKSILRTYNLSETFPENIQEQLASIPERVNAADYPKRIDRREQFTFTIDPDSAKDFDDALCVEMLPNDIVQVHVHIADIAAYIPEASPLDHAAAERGNSSYLIDHVVPMLPEKISNGIGSLVPKEDRLSKTVTLQFANSGKCLSAEFANSIIHSKIRLSYTQAEALLKNKSVELPLNAEQAKKLQSDLKCLHELAQKLRKRRMQNGSLELGGPETQLKLNAKRQACGIYTEAAEDAHQLIEEYMLAANSAVAKSLHHARLAYLSRAHEAPEAEKLSELREYLRSCGVACKDLVNRENLVELLERTKGHPQAQIFKTQVLRSLKQACYQPEHIGHYGLNKTHYAHFTSPIRRYADLINHRILDQHLCLQKAPSAPETKPKPPSQEQLASIGKHLSVQERNSQAAERDYFKIKLLEYLEHESRLAKPTIFKAMVVKAARFGFFIELENAAAFGLLPFATLKNRSKINIGSTLEVQVHRVDTQARQVDFKPAGKTFAPRKSLYEASAARKSAPQKSPNGASAARKSPNGTSAARKSSHEVSVRQKSTPQKSPNGASETRASASRKPPYEISAAQISAARKSSHGASAARKSAPRTSAARKSSHGASAARKSAPRKRPTPSTNRSKRRRSH